MYLGWFDDRTNVPVTQKVREGAAAYWQRFHVHPNIVLCNSMDFAVAGEDLDSLAAEGITLQSESYMVRNTFWIGVTTG